ncbi:TIGR00730 family Rossman fold protein [Rhabdothermincola salaria]|uniref:LOG family protein n=1 Tax=Rhabdothermincola salaria TaxID=2903142 RepID=UPI001E2D6109|nr:TIGR00730 family Rossman fold protein [Rhabdothermincola salaria]MCD9625641.1 TIGR00730 family Rossman fold protein [Rhabdothermincola salaria]
MTIGNPSPGELSSLCVFCGSSPGADPRFASVAEELGGLMVEQGLRLVYGGGHVGLMGRLADAVLAAGGEVHGVITTALRDREVAHRGLTRLDVVDTMHERKARMSDLADGFLMLPGGFGTLDEFFEAVTWTQLGIHSKPCAVLDVNGFFTPLVDFIDSATESRFISSQHRAMVITDDDPRQLLEQMATWQPPSNEKWLDRSDR